MQQDLEGWLRRLRLLTETQLFRAIRPALRLRSVPNPTNVLTQHPLYQHVYLLWLRLHERRGETAPDVALVLAEDDRVMAGMTVFAALLTLRALHDDGFQPVTASQRFEPGATLTLVHRDHDLPLTLTWDAGADELRLRVIATGSPSRSLTLVSAALALGAQDDDAIAALLRSLGPPVPASDGRDERALVCLQRRRTGSQAPGQGMTNAPRRDLSGPRPTLRTHSEVMPPAQPWLTVAVSPFEPLSVEWLARLLRAWLWPPLLAARPARLAALARGLPGLDFPETIWTTAELEAQLQLVAELRRQTEEETAQLEAAIAHGGGGQQHKSTRQSQAKARQAKQDLVAVVKRQTRLTTVADALRAHRENFAYTDRCVICGRGAVEASPQPEGYALQCQEPSCGGRAGVAPLADGSKAAFTVFSPTDAAGGPYGREGWQEQAEVVGFMRR